MSTTTLPISIYQEEDADQFMTNSRKQTIGAVWRGVQVCLFLGLTNPFNYATAALQNVSHISDGSMISNLIELPYNGNRGAITNTNLSVGTLGEAIVMTEERPVISSQNIDLSPYVESLNIQKVVGVPYKLRKIEILNESEILTVAPVKRTPFDPDNVAIESHSNKAHHKELIISSDL